MRKFTPVPIVLMVIVSIVLASGVLFPDTGSLPRLPSGPGTIGGVLSSFFGSDGSAHNTDTLSGVYASGYLQNKDCSTDPVNNVWKGVNDNGQGECGNTVGLLAIARFSELHGTVNVWKDGAPGYVPAVLGQDLHEGDLIESDSTGTGTIEFVEDSSLIRFWTDTDLELRYGDLGGLTVAEVILNDGRLWGRILSSTGVNLGGGGMVTGVRGTSVDIHNVAGIYNMTITDSVNTDNDIKSDGPVAIAIKDAIGASLPNVSFGGGTRFIYASGSNNVKKFSVDKNTFYSDPWFVKNAIFDITYMSDLLAGPAISATLSGKLNAELDATIVSNNTGTLYALLVGSAIGSHASSGAILLNEENQIDAGEPNLDILNKRKAKRLECKRQAKTYFPGLGSCEGSWDTLSATHFSSGTSDLYGKKGLWDLVASGSSNIVMTGTNFIQYNPNILQRAALSEKKVTVHFSGIPITNGIMGHFGGSSSLKWTGSSWATFGGVVFVSSTTDSVTFRLPATVGDITLGNNTFFNKPIGVTATSVTIR